MIKKVYYQILFYVALIAVWQLVFHIGTTALGWWKPHAFPNPFGVWQSLITMLRQNLLFTAISSSMRRALYGFLISILIGLATGIILSKMHRLAEIVKPLILGIQSLPSVCWVPFAILWFGLTESSIIFVLVIGSAFSISIAVESAIRNVNPLYIKAAKTMGARNIALYLRVVFPAGLPALITGLKLGWSFAWRALMAAEVMSATIGLGQTLMMGRDLADINRVMLIITIIIIIGVVIEKFVFSLAEERVLKRMGL